MYIIKHFCFNIIICEINKTIKVYYTDKQGCTYIFFGKGGPNFYYFIYLFNFLFKLEVIIYTRNLTYDQ